MFRQDIVNALNIRSADVLSAYKIQVKHRREDYRDYTAYTDAPKPRENVETLKIFITEPDTSNQPSTFPAVRHHNNRNNCF